MNSHVADVALLTEGRYAAASAAPDDWYLANILSDDRLLQAALASRGLTSARVDWARPDVDWSRFRCAVFRTTWDYFERFPEFAAWLGRVQVQTRFCNDASIVWWNVDKHYLADLEAKGVPIVPSRFIERGASVHLVEMLEAAGWDEAVVKPCVSGTARHTYRLNRRSADEIDPLVQRLTATEAFLLQPFQPDIMTSGEDSLMVVGGRFTHAVRKTPKTGDFRVQDDHGGVVRPWQATEAQIELAERTVAACHGAPAYGRVDVVRDERGELAVMEVELIEPELWLRKHPPAAEALAEAIARIVVA